MSIGSIEAFLRSDGRVGRTQYWIVTIITNIIISVLASFITPHRYSEPTWAFWLFILPLAIYQIHIAVKRAHDRNRSFLFVLLFFVPIVWFWPLIELGFFPRVDKDKAYGTRPLH